MPLRALPARRRQAASAGLGRHRRRLQDPRSTLRAAAHQLSASPRRRLQGPELQAGARGCSGRADAVGWRGIRDRGLCGRLRRRDDALARRMVGAASCQGACRAAAGLDRKIGEAAPKPWPAGDRPLAGLRVLDLSRVIAGPVAGRTLAVHGADVLLISGPDLPAIPWLTIDTGRGKLTSFVELKS